MALITTIAELKSLIATDANTRIDTISPYIAEAQDIYIKQLLGTVLLDELQTEYTDGGGTPGTQKYADLLPYVQRPLANYAYYLGFINITMNIGEAGLQQQHGEMSTPAPKWAHDQMKAKFLREGDRLADSLLAYLEANRADFASWADSPSNTVAEGLILPDAETASEYIEINESRRLYLKIKKKVKAVETKVIKPLICTAQYNALVSAIQADNADADETALIEVLRPIIAKMALWEAIPGMRLTITPDGIFMYSSDDSTIKKETADAETVAAYRKSLREGMTGYESDIEDAKAFILENIDTYTLIKNSECYTERPETGYKHVVENDEDNKHFAV